MKIFLIIVGIIVLIFVGMSIAVNVFNKKNKKQRTEMEMANRLPKEKQHLLAYGAILALYRLESPRTLQVMENPEILKDGLSAAWEVNNTEEAIQTLEWLLSEGHRTKFNELLLALKTGQSFTEEEVGKSQECYESAQEGMMKRLSFTKSDFDQVNTIAAWDFERAINIARWSYIVGYLTEDQAWNYIERAANAASPIFQSWNEYFISFAFGRAIAYEGKINDIIWKGKELLDDKDSIWNEFNFKRSTVQESVALDKV